MEGTRRVLIRDGAFQYRGSSNHFSWRSGIVVNVNAGVLVRITRDVQPFAEVSYLAGRASSATIGHLTVRAGVAVSLGIFARMVDPETTGPPKPVGPRQ